MNITKIKGADVYRDGGSYGFWFDSDDGNLYEFFIKTKRHQESEDDFYPPVIFIKGNDEGNIVKKFTWSEAKKYLSHLSYENTRFKELIEIVNNNGKYY